MIADRARDGVTVHSDWGEMAGKRVLPREEAARIQRATLQADNMALKRFLVFAFDPAAAAGGWRDYKGDADTKEEAERIAEQQHGRIQIVDTEFQEKVAGVNAHLVYTLYREYEYHQH